VFDGFLVFETKELQLRPRWCILELFFLLDDILHEPKMAGTALFHPLIALELLLIAEHARLRPTVREFALDQEGVVVVSAIRVDPVGSIFGVGEG
jgi:hypothetical protein